MTEGKEFSEETRAAVWATLVEVQEGTPLWSFSGQITVRTRRRDVGWPFASWALAAWLEGGFVDFVSDDTWTSRSLPAPGWAERASITRGLHVLAKPDALDLAVDVARWRDEVDGVVEAIPSLSAPNEWEEWLQRLEKRAAEPPGIGPDVVSRAEAHAQAAIDTSDLNRWFIFPAGRPSDK